MNETRDAAGGRVGVWFHGARGSVATTAICGLLALRTGLVEPVGCVSEHLGLPDGVLPAWDDIVVGGQDLSTVPLRKRAAQLVDGGVLPAPLLSLLDQLDEVEPWITYGYRADSPDESIEDGVRRMVDALTAFRRENRLDRVVVINVSSSESSVTPRPEHSDLDLLREAMARPESEVLPPSSVVAYAAFTAGCSFVDFTPSAGARLPALHAYAVQRGLPYAGSDGKTGETLLRSVLAPMFAARALKVRSWAGTNLLGGGDGANLGDPERASGKLNSKRRGLAALLGAGVTAPLHIDNVPDLGEQKVAWDHVSFEGFLGSRMSLQFTWTGYDSALAAPLVLDLARLTLAAHRAGRAGPLGALAAFFKDPAGTDEHRFIEQMRLLADWSADLAGDR
jgi:myo-inositol-1-phosphate synthase